MFKNDPETTEKTKKEEGKMLKNPEFQRRFHFVLIIF